ncbi:MAG TPA: hypothetical protein PKE12_02045 [Kiritimatiellia bacterium]|nr:hypothetical protein [Kiritimatiellia bacterium]
MKNAVAKKQQTDVEPPSEAREFFELLGKLGESREPNPLEVHRFRRLVFENPALLSKLQSLTEDLRLSLLRKLIDGATQARVMAEDDELRKEMGYRYATPMERLLIDQILSTRIHLIHAELMFNQKIGESLTIAASTYWQNFLSNAQRRHQRAIETLARVRRLARHGPLLQVNIANNNVQQTGTQGELPLASTKPINERESIVAKRIGTGDDFRLSLSPSSTLQR